MKKQIEVIDPKKTAVRAPLTYTTSTGHDITLRRVSIFTLELAADQVKRPTPPTKIVEGHEQPDYDSTEFARALNDYDEARKAARGDAIYSFGIELNTNDEATWQTEANDFRERFKSSGLTLPTNDWVLYIKHILLSTTDDFLDVQSLIINGRLPTPEEKK